MFVALLLAIEERGVSQFPVIGSEFRRIGDHETADTFDRVAKDGGFVFVAIPSTRWFGRQPITMAAPGKTVARYDVRSVL